MKTVPFIVAALLPACLEYPEPEAPPPPAIELGVAPRIAAGTTFTYSLPIESAALAGAVVTSSDPAILEARARGSNKIEFVSHGPGVVTVSATIGEEVLDTLEVTAVAVESIEVFYRAVPGDNAPVTALAALAGHADDVCVRYLGRARAFLAGRGRFTADTSAFTVGLGEESNRLSEALSNRSTCVTLEFAQTGVADLIASIDGGIAVHVPIEVVTEAPASAELALMALRNGRIVGVTDAVGVGEYAGANLIAKTADGRYLLGVDTVWTTTASTFAIDDQELVFTVPDPATVEVTATAGEIVRTRVLAAR